MWINFILENIHFALNLFAALVFFATMWLYFDAWLSRKSKKDGFKIAGLALLTLSFLIHGISIESTIITSPFLDPQTNFILVALTRFVGLVLLIVGLWIDPLQSAPFTKGLTRSSLEIAFFIPSLALSFKFLSFSFPILAAIVGFLYLRRATKGLENHLKPVSLAFYTLGFYELIALTEKFQYTSDINFYNLVAPFNLFWAIQHIILLISVMILGRWVYYYLTKRLQTQLFMIFTTTILWIFLLTAISFTGLLLRNLQDETLSRMKTDVRVLDYAIESKKGEILSDATVLAQNPQVIDSLTKDDKKVLSETAQNYLLTKKVNLLVIVNDNAQVMARGEDYERVGDSLSNDSLIKRALLGEQASSIVTKMGALAPDVSIRSATPVKQEDKIIGAVMIGTNAGNAFVDGIKVATGLDAAIYADNILSATTLLGSDGKSRYIGIKEESKQIKEQVLTKAESYTGSVNILNTPYFAAYLPLKDVDTNPVGMLFVGEKQITLLQVAGRSIELTFIITVILLVLSIFPAYFISKFITHQLK